MKLSKIIGISFGILTLFVIGTSEAKTYMNFGFGINVQQPRYAYAPSYVEEYYYPQEHVVVHHDVYGRTVSEHVYVTPARRTVHVVPGYRNIRQNSFFSFGFFR